MKKLFCFLLIATNSACGVPSSNSHNRGLAMTEGKSDEGNGIYDDSIRDKEVSVVNSFMDEVVKTKNYAQFNFPVVEEINNLFVLDLGKYLSNLRRLGYFSENYIIKDSVRLVACVKQFNSKLYTEDLEAGFFDNCDKCQLVMHNSMFGNAYDVHFYDITKVSINNGDKCVFVKWYNEDHDLSGRLTFFLRLEANQYLIDKIVSEAYE